MNVPVYAAVTALQQNNRTVDGSSAGTIKLLLRYGIAFLTISVKHIIYVLQ